MPVFLEIYFLKISAFYPPCVGELLGICLYGATLSLSGQIQLLSRLHGVAGVMIVLKNQYQAYDRPTDYMEP